ncbi:signal peptidase II, partial [Bacillus sp. SG-1]
TYQWAEINDDYKEFNFNFESLTKIRSQLPVEKHYNLHDY